jgi:hypothetical protein
MCIIIVIVRIKIHLKNNLFILSYILHFLYYFASNKFHPLLHLSLYDQIIYTVVATMSPHILPLLLGVKELVIAHM